MAVIWCDKGRFPTCWLFRFGILSSFKHAHNQLGRQKKSAYAEKVVRKKVELYATFFVRLVRSLINLWFSTNQIEETNKQIKLRWREVDYSLMVMLSAWKIVQNCLLLLYFLPRATTSGTTTAASATTTATTTNKSTATRVLHKWKSKLWRRRFR